MPSTPTDVKQDTGTVSPVPPVAKTEPKTDGQPVTPSPEVKSGVPSSQDVKTVPLPALQEERSKRQAIESENQTLMAQIAELKQMIQQQYQPQVQQPQYQQPQPNVNEELEKLWEEDPRKAVKVEIFYAMDYRDRIDASLELQADNLSRKYTDFNNFRSTALGQVRSLPLNQRGNPGVLEAAYFMVRGQNADQIVQRREQELLERYRRGDFNAASLATPPGSYSQTAITQENVLTPEQISVARAMGMSETEYAKYIKR